MTTYYAIKSVDDREENRISEDKDEVLSITQGHNVVMDTFTNKQKADAFLKETPVRFMEFCASTKSKSEQLSLPFPEVENEAPKDVVEEADDGLEHIYCRLSFERFSNMETGYTVNNYTTADVAGRTGGTRFTAKGFFLPSNKHVTYILKGNWIEDRKYGKQFEVVSYEEYVHQTRDGIIEYLSSGIIKGIGKKKAELIYKVFGNDTITVLDKEPEKLLKIRGISKKALDKIVDSWKENRSARELITYLLPLGISSKIAMSIYGAFRFNSLRVIRETPYELCRLRGFSFLMADIIAKKENLPMDSAERFLACAKYILKRDEVKGNLGMEQNNFGREMYKMLNTDKIKPSDINDRTIELMKKHILCARKMSFDNGETKQVYIFSNDVFTMENETAKDIYRIVNSECGIDEKKILKCMEEDDDNEITLDDVQMSAVITNLTNSLSVTTGGPGKGKTTIIKKVAKYYRQIFPDKEIIFMAPTGRAARKITEATGIEARTIHSTLHLRESSNNSEEDEVILENALVVVDEFSMTDAYVARSLFKAIGADCIVVLVGDIDQLPSVGAGAVLRDIIESGICKVVRLERVYRQKEDAKIHTNAENIRKGIAELDEGSDFHMIQCNDIEMVGKLMLQDYLNKSREYGVENVMCLCPYKEHPAGVYQMNMQIQAAINPENPDKKQVKVGKFFLREGDLVMNLNNDDEVSNGDVGTILSIDGDGSDLEITAFINNKHIRYKKDELDRLTLAYAMTIHKSQGSEAAVIITCLTKFHKQMLKRNMPYTAFTRGKENVDFIGDREALSEAILNIDTTKRVTALGLNLRMMMGIVINL